MAFLPILNTKTEKEKSEMTHCKTEWFAQISITLQPCLNQLRYRVPLYSTKWEVPKHKKLLGQWNN